MGKRQEAALETKKKLIDAVSALLKEKNPNEISIEEITTKAGVAKGSFYTYFKRKEDAVCCAAFRKYDSVKENALHPGDGIVANLGIYLNGSARIIDDASLRTAQGWMKSVTDPVAGETRGVDKFQFDSDNIEKLLENAVQRRELLPDTPVPEITELIMNTFYGAVAVWCITGGNVSLTDSMKHFCKYGLETILKNYKEEA